MMPDRTGWAPLRFGRRWYAKPCVPSCSSELNLAPGGGVDALQLLSFEILIWKKAKLWKPWVASLRFRRREQTPAVPRSQTACGLPSSHWQAAGDDLQSRGAPAPDGDATAVGTGALDTVSVEGAGERGPVRVETCSHSADQAKPRQDWTRNEIVVTECCETARSAIADVVVKARGCRLAPDSSTPSTTCSRLLKLVQNNVVAALEAG